MKRILKALPILGLLMALRVQAQITNLESGTSFLSSLTNWAVAPYLTYAPKAPEKFGGGALLIYNVSQNFGAALGADYLGRFSQVSGNIQFKLPTHPFSFIGNGFTNIQVTPFVMTGVAAPLSGGSGGNSTVSGIVGGGGYVDFAKLWGGEMSVGGALVNWSSAGAYSGNHYEVFLGWRKGF